MTVTFTNLSGSRENLDKTIRHLIQTNWTAGNITHTITPNFESDTEEPDQLAQPDDASLNTILVNYISRTRFDPDNMDFNGDNKHSWICTLLIQCRAESLQVMLDMEDEVNRILWENRPNSADRLNKSDSSPSEIAWFEDDEVEFFRVDPESEDDQTPTSEGELKMVYFKVKT